MVRQLIHAAWLAPLVLAIAAATPGCSRSKPASAFQKGKPVLKFDYTRVSRLEIAKDDPQTGDRWSAAFTRGEALGPQGLRPGWRITSGPDTIDLTDRLADGNFIEHLLDTLANLRVSEELAPEGSSTTLGLKPPRYWLRWQEDQRVLELKLGARVDSFSIYAEAAGTFVSLEGAALRMLDYLGDFRKIRHHKLMTWSVDDADRVSFGQNGKLLLEAERNSGDWSRAGGNHLKTPLTPLLEKIAHLEIDSFESAAASPIASSTSTWLSIEWRSRKDATLVLDFFEIRSQQGKDVELWARATDRPGAAFRLVRGAGESLREGLRLAQLPSARSQRVNPLRRH